jgi:tetratricopeptide (TPR) repeat protein
VPALVTTLTARLEAVDALHEQGRYAAALSACEDLVARAQDRADRPIEVAARSVAARCLLRRRDLEGARDHLEAAAVLVDPLHLAPMARYRAALARLEHAEGGSVDPLQAYLDWALENGHAPSEADACALLAGQVTGEERAARLQQALEAAERGGLATRLGRLGTDLGATLDELGRPEEALAAYTRALEHHRAHGSTRQVIGAHWAAGSAAARVEDYPLARERLEEAVRLADEAGPHGEAADLLALALADLARVHEAAGDVVEARRLVLRAVRVGRSQDLPTLWPSRWSALLAHGRDLDLDL